MMHPKIIKHRQSKPMAELKRKALKAKRKGFWTVEEVDYSKVWAAHVTKILHSSKDTDAFAFNQNKKEEV